MAITSESKSYLFFINSFYGPTIAFTSCAFARFG